MVQSSLGETFKTYVWVARKSGAYIYSLRIQAMRQRPTFHSELFPDLQVGQWKNYYATYLASVSIVKNPNRPRYALKHLFISNNCLLNPKQAIDLTGSDVVSKLRVVDTCTGFRNAPTLPWYKLQLALNKVCCMPGWRMYRIACSNLYFSRLLLCIWCFLKSCLRS